MQVRRREIDERRTDEVERWQLRILAAQTPLDLVGAWSAAPS